MAPAQPTFSDLEASSGRVTRRRRFLAPLDSKIPWGAWAARVEPHYPKAGNGRPPVPLGTMLRMYVVQVAFRPSDEGTEDALWDSAAVRSFVGCGDAVPDATTPCRFRSLLAANGPGRALLDEPDASLEAVAGTVHTLEATAASARDLTRAASPVGPGDADVWADSGYTGVSKWVEGTPAASARWHMARRKRSVPEDEHPQESMLASARSRVEHAFHTLKDLVGLRRTRYRGLAKVTSRPCAAFAVANCLLASRRPPLQGPPACAQDRVRPRSELVGVLGAAAAAA